MSSMDTATSKGADMPIGAEIGNMLQAMSEDVSLLHTLAPPDAIGDITMLSPDPRYKNRDMVDTKPYNDSLVDIQTLEIEAYPNDQAIADVLVKVADQNHSTYEQMRSSSAQQPWTPRAATDNFQGSRNEIAMSAFQYGSTDESLVDVSLTQMSPSLQRYDNEPGHLDSQFHLAFEHQSRPVHGVDVLYDASYPQGFQAPSSDFDDIATASNLSFGFEAVSRSVSNSHLYLAPSEATLHGSFAGTPQLLGESLSPTQASTARQSSSELGTVNGRLGRNDESWKRDSTWPFNANMSEGIYMVEDVEDMVKNDWNSYPSMK
ncbi:uncharacterized protein PAC_13066 [Phialocephala subalpina]|uniref:Uncharacterized protein n=1 Tax=Phialocephala subalpina TaxID=576137 RepID=A0A1L7XDP6_9HELO|nr:uncharacterized protein PAC_13066 [Phialocephala subalpina]